VLFRRAYRLEKRLAVDFERGLGGVATGYELEGLGLELLAVLVVRHVARVYSESERGAGQLSVSRTGRVAKVVVVEAQQWSSFKRFVQPGRPEIAEPRLPAPKPLTSLLRNQLDLEALSRN
jgi:hypothetical protein